MNRYGMQLNKRNTNIMVYSKDVSVRLNINVDNEQINMHNFKYLGSSVTEDGRRKNNIIWRIAQAKNTFQNKSYLYR